MFRKNDIVQMSREWLKSTQCHDKLAFTQWRITEIVGMIAYMECISDPSQKHRALMKNLVSVDRKRLELY